MFMMRNIFKAALAAQAFEVLLLAVYIYRILVIKSCNFTFKKILCNNVLEIIFLKSLQWLLNIAKVFLGKKPPIFKTVEKYKRFF